jgi:hypothetical protein
VDLQNGDNHVIMQQVATRVNDLRGSEKEWWLPLPERHDWLWDGEPDLYRDEEVRIAAPGHDEEAEQIDPGL